MSNIAIEAMTIESPWIFPLKIVIFHSLTVYQRVNETSLSTVIFWKKVIILVREFRYYELQSEHHSNLGAIFFYGQHHP
jgi:hypothetical protein